MTNLHLNTYLGCILVSFPPRVLCHCSFPMAMAPMSLFQKSTEMFLGFFNPEKVISYNRNVHFLGGLDQGLGLNKNIAWLVPCFCISAS